MKIELLDKTKKKKILALLEKDYGIEELSHLFIETGKGKYRIYSGGLSREELNRLGKDLNVEIIGASFCKIENDKIRINFDALNIPEIKNQINKNVLEIEDEEMAGWLKGDNIETKKEFTGAYILIKHKNDALGNGQNSKDVIKNYIPKERRVR